MPLFRLVVVYANASERYVALSNPYSPSFSQLFVNSTESSTGANTAEHLPKVWDRQSVRPQLLFARPRSVDALGQAFNGVVVEVGSDEDVVLLEALLVVLLSLAVAAPEDLPGVVAPRLPLADRRCFY